MASNTDFVFFLNTSFGKNVMGNAAIKGFSSKSVRILKHTHNVFVKEFYRKIELKKKCMRKCLMCKEIKIVLKFSFEKNYFQMLFISFETFQ